MEVSLLAKTVVRARNERVTRLLEAEHVEGTRLALVVHSAVYFRVLLPVPHFSVGEQPRVVGVRLVAEPVQPGHPVPLALVPELDQPVEVLPFGDGRQNCSHFVAPLYGFELAHFLVGNKNERPSGRREAFFTDLVGGRVGQICVFQPHSAHTVLVLVYNVYKI